MMVSQLIARVRLFERQHIRGDHEAGADDRRAGAIDPEAGETSDCQNRVRRQKYEDRRHVHFY